ncbi:MAG: hypothetical protein QG673_475, partial [Pseudomonadota bacterium]|nr:hypothetical protein [Pseudomonadota bacterium]
MAAKILKICHITSVHPRYDIRIFVKECRTLANIGANASADIAKINYTYEHDVSLIVADELADEIKDQIKIYSVGKAFSRKHRIFVTCRKIYNRVLELNPDVVHFHDPELMPVGLRL